MVKSNNKNRSTKKPNGKAKPKQARMIVRSMIPRRILDAPAMAYARLLSDPCGASLTHPIYAGSEGGILIKAESVFTIMNAAGQTYGAVHWTPGAIGTGNTELLVASNSLNTLSMTADANTPGKVFLAANATGVRCVAACMQVTYLGTELNRAGTIAIGRTQGSLVDPISLTPGDLETALEHFSRCPDSTVEMRWVPANMDQSFTDPNVATPAQERDRKSAITLLSQGLTAASGLRIRLVAIYEYQPRYGTGIATPSSARATSSFSLDDVLNYVQKATNVVTTLSAMYNRRAPAIEL
jgi:hypothetical protein